MNILIKYIQTELIVKKSRFLSELLPCEDPAAARSLIKSQKTKYSDATHVVHAFVLGAAGEILGMSDDGEPSGTAGRPALDVLKGFGCTNTLLTITRWFGGTLLGTGGLVKAYGTCAKQVLAAAASGGLFQELVHTRPFSFSADYTLYQTVKGVMTQFNISDVSEQFGTAVTVAGRIRTDEYSTFAVRLKDISCGRINI